MRFLLVIPPYVVDENGFGILPKKAMLPVGPLSVATALLQRGHNVKVVDYVFSVSWKDDLDGVMTTERFDHVLLSCHTARNIPIARQAVDVIRAIKPDAHITVGGNVCLELGSADFQRLGLNVNAVVRGYGHSAEIIEALIACTNGDLRGPAESRLPVPALRLLDTLTRELYCLSNGKYPLVATQLGCRWNCGYCSAKIGSRSVLRMSADVLTELMSARALGYQEIWCVDNICTVDPDAIRQFDRMVAALGLTWSGMTRPELAAEQAELFKQFKACTEIAMGVEAATESELRIFHRGARVDYLEACIQAFQNVNEAGITSNAFVMLGGPSASEKNFWSLYRFLKRLEINTVSWSFYNPSPRLLLEGARPEQFGFYNWPFGECELSAVRIVQHAMILVGTWWKKLAVNRNDPFVEGDDWFGIRLMDGTFIWQELTVRSPIGDLWVVWQRGGEIPC